jgi:hypothetical protein
MKYLLVFVALGAMCLTGLSETFMGVTSATNKLLLATNEAAIFYRLNPSSSPIPCQLVKDGQIHNIFFSVELNNATTSTYALVGPCELIITNNVLLNFRRVPGSTIQTSLIPPASPNPNQVVLNVPDGKSLRFFEASGGVTVSRGTNVFQASFIRRNPDEEFTGPLTITITGYTGGTESRHISYYFTDTFTALPQGVGAQTASGVSQIGVEKSGDLTNWSPTILQDIRNDQKAYYRLRITK